MAHDSLSPDEAFAVLGDETRIAILRVLFENATEPMSFSELRDAVGMRDSGQFNYHLGKLVEQFVRKTDEGYRLRLAGWQVVGAILSGTYTESGNTDPVSFDHPCPSCGGTVVATYEDERMHIRCADCKELFEAASIPPGALEGFAPEELTQRFEQYMRGLVGHARLGICLSCQGRMSPKLSTDPDPENGVDLEDTPVVEYRCRRCPEVVSVSLGTALLDHPAVVSFHWEHGIDLRTVSSWSLAWLTDDRPVVESETPLRVRLRVELDGDVLELVVDESLSVVETVRT
ncbi:ArsR/SmtB family transcription factor [Haladaptatus sp. NG-WS-4]